MQKGSNRQRPQAGRAGHFSLWLLLCRVRAHGAVRPCPSAKRETLITRPVGLRLERALEWLPSARRQIVDRACNQPLWPLDREENGETQALSGRIRDAGLRGHPCRRMPTGPLAGRQPAAPPIPDALVAGLGRSPREVWAANDHIAVFENEETARAIAPPCRHPKHFDMSGTTPPAFMGCPKRQDATQFMTM